MTPLSLNLTPFRSYSNTLEAVDVSRSTTIFQGFSSLNFDPRSLPGDVSSRDWRLLQLAAVAQLAGAGGLGLDSLVFFVGYSLKWSSIQVNFFISWIGTTRTFVLFLIVPALLAYLARTNKKPKDLVTLNEEDLERVSRDCREMELEGEAGSSDHLVISDENGGISRNYEDEREWSRLRQSIQTNTKIKQSMASWRTRIDLKLLKISIFCDALGWLVAFGGAQSLSNAAIILSGAVLSFGAGVSASIYSIGVAIAVDLYHKGFDVGGTPQEAADSFMGAIAFVSKVVLAEL